MRYPALLSALILAMATAAAERQTESFDADPGWDGHNNRTEAISTRTVIQDFGYVRNDEFPEGAIGGSITPDGAAAYYAKDIGEKSLDDPLHASGTLTVKKGGGNVLLGFFNSETINEWRTPNSLVFRINGRGDTFHVHVEYGSSKWRATASVIGRVDPVADRVHPVENPSGETYRWTLAYDPAANGGAGAVRATLNDMETVMDLTPELRADGARFNRFGFLNVVKHADDRGEFYIGDLAINGEPVDLSADPGWCAQGNRAHYESLNVRPRFDFGYSATNHAAGAASGEIGGLFFRGDCRYPEKLAYYGARLDTLTLAKPIRASGKVVLRRAISDSTTLFGFFHSEHSVQVNESQKSGLPSDFLGFAIEGPSAQGFYVYPAYRVHGEGESHSYPDNPPRIYPDGVAHDWTLAYEPDSGGGGTLTLTLDDNPPATIAVSAEDVAAGAQFNRFGFVTPWIDGNGQVVYLDDLSFTAAH